MAFDEKQLAEIKDRLPVSEVVGARFELIKKGGSEYVVKDNPSFTVNDNKQFWCEFGKDGDAKPHDIFDFLQIYEGFTFVGAVEELARKAGVDLHRRPGRSTGVPDRLRDEQGDEVRARGNSGEGNAADGSADRDGGRDQSRGSGKKEIVATWDIKDPELNLLYQVVRLQKQLPDGSWEKNKEGKTWKSFGQRRPSPDGDGTWVWSLSFLDHKGKPIEFMRKGPGRDWLRFDAEKFEKWHYSERRTFGEFGNVEHWLYNANDVIDELQQDRDDQRTIFFPEGEAKVDVLRDWSLLAVSNTGGAKHFTEACAEFFRGAKHVVILQDNDRAGAERTAKIAPMLKAVDVELVSVLNFRDIWTTCPAKGDVKDWRDQGGGTRDALLEAVDSLKPWTPEPYKSKFGAKTAADLIAPARPYPWRIKGLVPRDDDMLVMGPSRSGKSFEVLDMAMAVHFDDMFAGRRVVEPGGCVYLTYEGATGFENRVRAYMVHRELTAADLHSFAWLTRPPGIYASEDNVAELADEVVQLASKFKLPLACVVIDTHNAATRGSSEVKSEDIDKIVTRYRIISDRVGAPLWIIGHTNAEGRHRGNEQFFNGIETAMLVRRLTVNGKPDGKEVLDDEGRIIRRVEMNKQRDGSDRIHWDFVLRRVKIGVDEDGDEIPGMFTSEPSVHHQQQETEQADRRNRPDAFQLSANNAAVFNALLKALDSHGVAPPPELGLPSSVSRVVNWADLGVEYKRSVPQEQDESLEKYRGRIKARTRRFREDLHPYNVIGIASVLEPGEENAKAEKPKMRHYVWPTGRKVIGKGRPLWPAEPKKKTEAGPLLAPGESPDDLGGPPKTVF